MPAVRVPVGLTAVKVVAVMLFAPLDRVVGVAGNVIAYVETPDPVTVNDAAVTVPATTGNVTPPVNERAPAGVKTTVPADELTAMFPKFISIVLEMLIGVIMVAVAVAVACAKELAEKPITASANK